MWKMIGAPKGLQKRDPGPVGGPRQTSLRTGTVQDLAKSAALTGYVYLLVDRSHSMKKGNKIKQAQKGAIKFAKNALEQGYYTGLIQFDDLPTLVCEPEKDITKLEKAISTLTTGKHTHMAKAIRLAHSLLKNQTGMRVMVIVTDGLPNGEGDPQSSLKAAEEARKDGIYIIAIGTDDANSEFLKHLATRFDLGVKIERNQLASAIIDSSRLLPPPQNKLQKRG